MHDDIELLYLREMVLNGRGRDDLLRRARRGELTRVRPGSYAQTRDWADADELRRMRSRIHATQAAARHRLLFCGASAAILHGIPLLTPIDPRPHVLVAPGGGKSNASVRRTERAVQHHDGVEAAGLFVTAPLATAIDVAADLGPLAGALAISHVRHAGTSRDAFLRRVAGSRPFRGVAAVDRAIAVSSGGSESALESLVMVRCADLGFELPAQQVRIVTARGAYRVDFAWYEGRLVLEADGKRKYGDPELLRGRTPAEVVWDEKRREDAIRRAVDGFARTTWADAIAADELERTLIELGVPRIRPRRSLTR